MTTNFTLRLPDETAAKIDVLAAESGQSRHGYIVNVLQELAGDEPQIILGYIRLIGGDINSDDDCPECLQPYTIVGVPHVPVIKHKSGNVTFGDWLICGQCAAETD